MEGEQSNAEAFHDLSGIPNIFLAGLRLGNASGMGPVVGLFGPMIGAVARRARLWRHNDRGRCGWCQGNLEFAHQDMTWDQSEL